MANDSREFVIDPLDYMNCRVGVTKWDDGFSVTVWFHGEPNVYDPAFPTEEEAQATAKQMEENLRNRFARELAARGRPLEVPR